MRNYNTKLLIIGIVFTLILLFLIGKIGYIQIAKGEEYQRMAVIQQVSKIDKEIIPVRGSILDRNNYEIAISRRVFDVVLDCINFQLQDAEFKENQLRKMSEILDIPIEEIRIMSEQNTHYKVIKKNVTKDLVDMLMNEDMENILYEEVYKRKYVYDNFASNVIGFANETMGLWGIEKKYDLYLRGTQGRKFITFKGNNMLVQEQIEPKDGYNLILTIDKNIQNIIEKNLYKAVEQHNPKNAAIIVMDPNTGEILGLADYPNFNLNSPMKIENEDTIKKLEDYKDKSLEEKLNVIWRNFAINDTYEPGSTYKAIVMAAALDEGSIDENSTFYCNGSKNVAGQVIHCGNRNGHGNQSLEEALANSCNIAIMEIAEKVGKEKFYYYQKLFGFGQNTGVDLLGEESAKNLLHKLENIGPVELATSSFGQSFNVTPIQMITAFSSVINGGKLLKPYVVVQVVDKNLNVIEQNQTTVVRKTVSPKTSEIMAKYLENVVSKGTGNKAYIEGYKIGGKTATSEKLPRGSGKYTASFIAFAPTDDPKVVLLVIVDEPSTEIYSGGSVAGPVAKECMEEILIYMGIPKIDSSEDTTTKLNLKNQMIMLEDYTNKNLIDAILKLNSSNIKYKIIGNGSNIVNQVPKPNTLIPLDGEVLLYVETGENSTITVPNLIGKTYEEAMQILNIDGLELRVGDKKLGKIVSEQIPVPGTKLDIGSEVYVKMN